MQETFAQQVGRKLGPFLSSRHFALEASRESDGGNMSELFFRSPEQQLYFYRSMREGEVNCKIAPLGARNTGADGDGWVYARSMRNRRLSFEELLAQVPDKPQSDDEQLEKLGEILKQDLDAISAGLREL